jgi:serine/threonine-protein kinase
MNSGEPHSDSPGRAPAQAPVATPVDRDERLAALLLELTERLRQGDTPQFDAIAQQHPDLADELRELWTAVRLAEELASSDEMATIARAECLSDEQSPTPAGVAAVYVPRNQLPRTFGDFELLDELGAGGMGTVYMARQRSLDRVVAIKMLKSGEMASAVEQARFRAEAESAAGLDHPHVVPVYEVGVCDGQPYFSMRHVAGENLARRLERGPLEPRAAVALVVPLARAIEYAHRQGILHRDLKPSNVLIDERGQPLLTDFGLAKRVDDQAAQLTRSGAILGTPSYMPPEQASGERGQLGPASDVYGLGTILYHAITGQPPFQAATAMDTILLVLEQEPVPPRLLNRKVDRDLEMIVLRCLQKPPDLRYPTAAALADDLERYLAGERVAARSGGFTDVLGRVFRDTYHAPVLENWGLLWMWHSLALLALCLATNWCQWQGVESRMAYLLLWSGGLGTWAAIFWGLRRRAGPVTFIERQIAHVWAASVLGSIALYGLEYLMDLPVLSLSPVLALFGASVFVVKAGILSGAFYVQATAMFATSAAMAIWPTSAHALFGLVAAACFFVPGWQYYRRRGSGRETPTLRP